MNYIVRDFDTPQRVAAKVYGSWILYKLILDNNMDFVKNLPDNNLTMGTILTIPEPPALINELRHIVAVGDTWMSLSQIYYESVSFSRKLEKENNFIRLDKSIGAEIFISPLVSKKVYENARRLINA